MTMTTPADRDIAPGTVCGFADVAYDLFLIYWHRHAEELLTQPLQPALWMLPNGCFTYTLSEADHAAYLKRPDASLLTYLTVPPSERFLMRDVVEVERQ